MNRPPIAFGPFLLDARRGTLFRQGVAQPLGQRAFAVLRALAEADGEPVSKSELLEHAWSGAVVEEGNLPVQIATLRKVLGRTSGGEERIVTLSRFGYRLALERDESAGHAGEVDPATTAAALPSLAVLPFLNLDERRENAYFADGVVEDVLTGLGRFQTFTVVSRNSSFAYRDQTLDTRRIATELGVRYLLQGSLRRDGERLRIACQLVDGATDRQLWGATFDGSTKDLFAFQDQITESVVVQLVPQIQKAEIARSRRERPLSFTAYDFFLQALPRIHSEVIEDNLEADALLARALVLEPDNALYLAHAAWVIEHRLTVGWPAPDERQEDRERCIALAHRALRFVDGDGPSMAKCATSLIQVARDYDLGMAVIAQALTETPHHAEVLLRAGTAMLHCGSLEAAETYLERVVSLSPGDPLLHASQAGLGHVAAIRGQWDRAREQTMRALATNPHYEPTYWILIAALVRLEQLPEARQLLTHLQTLSPEVSIARIRDGQPAQDPARMEAILEGLRAAGLRED